MRNAELPSQFASNGQGERYGLSPKDIRRFVNNVAKSPVPDIDNVRETLPRVMDLYKKLGVSLESRKRITQGLEEKLYGGTATEQAAAAESLFSLNQSLNQGYEIYRRSLEDKKNIEKMAKSPTDSRG